MRHTLKHLLLPSLALLCVAGGVRAESMSADTLNAPSNGASPAGNRNSPVPDRIEPQTPKFQRDTAGVGITEHLGGNVPLDLPFVDATGRQIVLGDYFKQGRPVILQLGYFNCPMLCDVVSKGLMDGVKDLADYQPGRDYDLLYVSVNPNERWQLGQSKKRTYVEEFGRPGAVEGWNFLVGKQDAIKPLADAVGFGFKQVEGREEFSHPPMIVVLTAGGKISRYLYGFQYPSSVLKQGIDEAKAGKVGSYVEQIVVALCYHYDEYAGKYSLSYMRLMQGSAILTVLVVLTVLGSRWVRDARAARPRPGTPHTNV